MSRNLIVVLAITSSALAFAVPAQAQATRTWVSGVGDDANPCSRTAPCKTFAGAISKTAASGVISVLDPGGFGAVTITKSITIDGGGIGGSILSALTNGIIVNAGAGDEVFLRSLAIDGAGSGTNGIRVLNAGAVHIEDLTITDVTGRCIDVQGGPSMIYVTDTHVSACAGGGVYIQNARATIMNLTAGSSQYGVRAGPTAPGHEQPSSSRRAARRIGRVSSATAGPARLDNRQPAENNPLFIF